MKSLQLNKQHHLVDRGWEGNELYREGLTEWKVGD